MGMWFTGSWESVVIFSLITPNVNFVETYMFIEFQKHLASKINFNYTFSMSAVHVWTI